MGEAFVAIFFIIAIIFFVVIVPGFRVIRQFERGVVFTLGKYTGVRGPGLRIIVPYFQTITRVDVRSTPIDVPKQEVITKDNVTVNVDAIVYFRVLDPSKALLEWGIDIENVKLQNIELPGDMKRAMAKQAEAERERRAAIIVADGEKASANAVAEAAHLLARTPGGLQIRTLQTLEKISSDPSQKTVIVLPSDMQDVVRKLAA